MATLVNLTGHPLGLPTGHVVPVGGTLDVAAAVLACPDNVPFLAGQRLSGALRIEAETSADPPTSTASAQADPPAEASVDTSSPADTTDTPASPPAAPVLSGPVSPLFTTAPDDGASTKG